MAWSDAARAAALEVRRRKSTLLYKVLESRSGMTKNYTRSEMAREMKSIRTTLRTTRKLKKRDLASLKGQLSNLRYASRTKKYATQGTKNFVPVGRNG